MEKVLCKVVQERVSRKTKLQLVVGTNRQFIFLQGAMMRQLRELSWLPNMKLDTINNKV